MDWFLSCSLMVVMFTGMVFGVGTAVLNGVGRDSPLRRRQGVFVLRWVVGGVFAGGCLGLVRAFEDNGRYFHEYGGAFMGLGVIAGTIIGNSHGAARARLDSRPPT